MDQSTHDVRLAKWLPIIQECVASGMSKAAWCKVNDINPKQLYYWQRKARTALLPKDLDFEQVSAKTTTFTPVPLASIHKSQDSAGSFTPNIVVRSNGFTIEISNTVSSELLTRIGGMLCAK